MRLPTTYTQRQFARDEFLRSLGLNPTRPIVRQLPLPRLYCSSLIALLIAILAPERVRHYTPCPHHGCCTHDYPGPSCTPACELRTNKCDGRFRTPGGSVGIRV